MRRTHRAFLLAAALSSAPLAFAEGAAAASPPSALSAWPTSSEPAAAQTMSRSELEVPPTPMPLSLPDPARPEEMAGEYAVGIFTLTAAAVLTYAAILALVYFTMRRSWAAAH